MKRALDIVVSLLVGVAALPLLGLGALGTFITLGRPVFFRQVRPGLDGQPFVVTKLRTMGVNAPGETKPDTERLTRFGRWLRATSVDELPQLLSVIRGEMSLVGPRPLLLEYLPLYDEKQAQRHRVRPGITGWAQVNGRNKQRWEDHLEQDVWYVQNWSLSLDLRIMALTALRVIARDGVQPEGQVTRDKFRGAGTP